jgi:hypothetical protein
MRTIGYERVSTARLLIGRFTEVERARATRTDRS